MTKRRLHNWYDKNPKTHIFVMWCGIPIMLIAFILLIGFQSVVMGMSSFWGNMKYEGKKIIRDWKRAYYRSLKRVRQ